MAKKKITRKQNLRERMALNYPDSPIMGTGIFVAKKKKKK